VPLPKPWSTALLAAEARSWGKRVENLLAKVEKNKEHPNKYELCGDIS
jgi:hypothetical protein